MRHLALQQLPSLAAVEYDVEEALGLIIQLLNSAVLLGVGVDAFLRFPAPGRYDTRSPAEIVFFFDVANFKA